MSASAVLLVAASIVASDGTLATIDAGETQLLEPGDQGQAFYELVVNGDPQRIEVGPIVVASVTDASATVASESGVLLRPGHRAEFRLAPERLKRPADLGHRDPRLQSAVPPVPAPAVPEVSPPAAVAPPEPEPEPTPPPRNALTISAGHYAIGLDPQGAEFFDQTPRHEVLLRSFAIDRYVMGKDRSLSKGGAPVTDLAFFEAQERCSRLGLRLPSEQEWEIAAQTPGFHTLPGVFEWTTSWYEAYPGNSRSEAAYGETHKVLKGSEDGSADALFSRRFMMPDQRNAQVGFRCAKDLP